MCHLPPPFPLLFYISVVHLLQQMNQYLYNIIVINGGSYFV